MYIIAPYLILAFYLYTLCMSPLAVEKLKKKYEHGKV